MGQERVGQEEMADTPEMALDRIEAALNRIASGTPPGTAPAATMTDTSITDTSIIAARLDGLIARLRDALANVAG